MKLEEIDISTEILKLTIEMVEERLGVTMNMEVKAPDHIHLNYLAKVSDERGSRVEPVELCLKSNREAMLYLLGFTAGHGHARFRI